MSRKKIACLFKWLSGGAIVVALILLFVFLTRGSEEYMSNDTEKIRIESLNCSTSGGENAFFVSETAQRYTHTIRMAFKDDKLSEVFYVYEGTYNSPEAVEAAASNMHADYNKYMGKNNSNPEKLNPSFSNLKSKLKITLFAEKNKIDNVAAKLFYLNEDELGEIDEYGAGDFGSLYESKGFSCTYKE